MYRIRMVYKTPVKVVFYIVNDSTRDVQSVWDSVTDARRVVSGLNKMKRSGLCY